LFVDVVGVVARKEKEEKRERRTWMKVCNNAYELRRSQKKKKKSNWFKMR